MRIYLKKFNSIKYAINTINVNGFCKHDKHDISLSEVSKNKSRQNQDKERYITDFGTLRYYVLFDRKFCMYISRETLFQLRIYITLSLDVLYDAKLTDFQLVEVHFLCYHRFELP